MLQDPKKFKKENQKSWDRNQEYWINSPLRHVVDTERFFKNKLTEIVTQRATIVDIGCGNGWLLDDLLELNRSISYIGFDFSRGFIRYLKDRYSKQDNAIFKFADIEKPISREYHGIADIVFNCFNFFETTNLTKSFANSVKLLKPEGKLVILTIDYTYLILALSPTMKQFKLKLKMYEKFKTEGVVPYYFQPIDLGDSQSNKLKYASVLYSFGDYFKQAKRHDLSLVDYDEVVKTSKYLPKTYQYFVFQKRN
jgi:SAM-dependent methyltransferase